MALIKDVLINVSPGETRVALMEDERLAEVIYERARPDDEGASGQRGLESHVGSIFLGRVQRVLPGVQAAFVDIGLRRAGFLSARDARRMAKDYTGIEPQGSAPSISDLVREGDELLVQVTKDPISEKGARLTARPTLPGRLLVLVPGAAACALSRRIENEADRTRLLELMETLTRRGLERHGLEAGLIARTAALDATLDELAEDADRLCAQWRTIVDRRAGRTPPALLYRDVGLVASTLRDHVNRETRRIWIDDAQAFAAAQRYAQMALPELADRITLHKGPAALFEEFGVEEDLARMMDARVPLPSGGWITIDTTEALTAIDVNSGSLETGCLEETALKTNLEAAEEIGRQVRLRGIGGLIVIDFIHIGCLENAGTIDTALREALARDRTPMQISEMNAFGLVEMTRKRVREPLSRLLTGPCQSCGGHGRIRSAGTVANDVLRRIHAEWQARPGRPVHARVSPDVAAWIEARTKTVLAPLKDRVGPGLRIEPVRHFSRERFEVDVLAESAS